MTNAAAPAITFGTFGKIDNGSCPGSDITVAGQRAGYIERVLEARDVGTVQCTWKYTVSAYRVVMFGEHAVENEPEFATLAMARAFVRGLFVKAA
jgi:hypothetical protein